MTETLSPKRAEALRRVRWAEETLADVKMTTRAEICGISVSYYQDLRRDDPIGEKQRARRDSWTGVCADCGGVTRSNGTSHASRLCADCGRLESARTLQQRRGTGPVQRRVLSALAESGELRYMEIRDRLGMTNEVAAEQLHRLVRYGLIVRVGRGRYVLSSDERVEERVE